MWGAMGYELAVSTTGLERADIRVIASHRFLYANPNPNRLRCSRARQGRTGTRGGAACMHNYKSLMNVARKLIWRGIRGCANVGRIRG